MKKTIYTSIIILISFSFMSSTCSSDDDDGGQNNNDQTIEQVNSTMTSGTWKIKSYIDSGEDETSDFIGYNFTFSGNGTLTAQNNSTSMEGTWSVTQSGSNDDESDDLDFNILFPVPDTNDFEDLNDDWDIDSYSSSLLSLIDISGGNGGTDTLIFEKN